MDEKAVEVLDQKRLRWIALAIILSQIMWLEMKKLKHLLTSLGFQETGFIEENNEVAMRLDLKKEE